MSEFDLDALRAEREAVSGPPEPKSFTFGGQTFELPARLSWRVTVLMGKEQLDEALSELLGAEQYQRFLDLDPAVEDIKALAEQFEPMYVTPPAEAAKASTNGSRKAKS